MDVGDLGVAPQHVPRCDPQHDQDVALPSDTQQLLGVDLLPLPGPPAQPPIRLEAACVSKVLPGALRCDQNRDMKRDQNGDPRPATAGEWLLVSGGE